MIDIYCERTAPGLLNEPLNAITNLAFIVAAWLCWRLVVNTDRKYASAYVLVGLAATIGTGSALFHTFATHWAELCDKLPILFFQLAFIGCYFRFVQGWGYTPLAALFAIFFGLVYVSGQYPYMLNGSLMYAPAFVLLAFSGSVHYLTGKTFRYGLLLAAGVFVMSLTFRSIDMAVCSGITVGTHFLWHLLNGLLIYLVMRAYIVNLPPKSATLEKN